MADIRVGEKRLDQLKVAELRDLLEKRGLSKTGVKVELVKRLTEAMSKEEPEEMIDGDGTEVEVQSNILPSEEFPMSSSLDTLDKDSEMTSGVEDVQHTEGNTSESILSGALDKDSSVQQEISKAEGKGEFPSTGLLEAENPQSFVHEGTPLQDENSEMKNGDASAQEDSDIKEPDPVIDLHVRDAFEMNEDVALQDGKEGNETVKRSGRNQEYSSKCHLWVSGAGGSLNKSITAVDLQDFFSQCGTAVSARIVAPRSRYYPPKRYGFVTMKTEKEADICIRELNLREIKGQKLLVEIAKHPPPSSGGQNADDYHTVPEKSGDGGGSRSRDSRKDGAEKNFQDGKESNKGSEQAKESDMGHDKEEPSQGSDPDRKSPDRERRRESPRRRSSLERRPDRRRRVRSRSPRRNARSPVRRHSPRGRSPARNDLRRIVRGSDERGGPFDGRSRGLLPDPVPSSSRGSISRFEGRLEPRSDIIVRTTEELFQRELAIQRHEKQLAEQMKALRDREMKEKISSIEQERRYRERERELMDRERRDRQLREELESELKHKAMKEKELIERERKSLEQMEKQLHEREIRFREEKESRLRELEDKERQLREKERMLEQRSSYDYSPYTSPHMNPSQKRPLGPGQSEYEVKRTPPAHMVSPYSMSAGRSNVSGGSDLNTPSSSGWSGMGSTHSSYQSHEQDSYSTDKKQLKSYDSGTPTSSYSGTPGYSQGRPVGRQQESMQYNQFSPSKERGSAPVSKPNNPHSTPGDHGQLQGWRNQSPRSTIPSSSARGYGHLERPSSSGGGSSAPGHLSSDHSGSTPVTNRSPFPMRGRGRGRGRGGMPPHAPPPPPTGRFPPSRDSGMPHMYSSGGRRY